MKLRLLSDFHDYYDHHFDINTKKIYKRYANRPIMNRREAFEYMEKSDYISCEVACHGIGRNLFNEHKDRFKYVIYLDENSHQGKNKILVDYEKAQNEYQDYYASVYIKGTDSHSIRYLYLGRYVFEIEYRSDHAWKSNCGNVDIRVLNYKKEDEIINKDFPLCAVDTLGYLETVAVDFNTAPQLKGTGIDKIFYPIEIVEEIKRFFEITGGIQ